MRLTGLSEFLWMLLVFGALFAFTVWRQQRDRRRREERLAALSAPVEVEPAPVGPAPPPPEVPPDIAWGRGPAAPVPLEMDRVEVPVRAEPAVVPPRMPSPTRAPRRAPAARPPAAPRPGALQLRSGAGLRQAVVALTVLGPCRALEPYGGPGLQPAPDGRGPGRRPGAGGA